MSIADSEPVYYDPYKIEIRTDPYPTYRRLRDEAPLYYNAQYDFYAVSRYTDVERGLRDSDTYISGRGDILEIIKSDAQFPRGTFIMEDPPLHTVHRSVVSKVFTPRKMNALEPKIREFCARCLDPLIGAGRFDFVTDLGAKMPMRVIGMLLGIPEQDLELVRERADASLRTEAGKPMVISERNFDGAGYEEYVKWRTAHPSDDLMTELLNTEFTDETGAVRKLDMEEILSIVNIIAGAGNETTNRLIGWMGKILAENPGPRREIVGDRSLIPHAIEEILRFEPPGPQVARYVNRDTELYGQKISHGSAVVFLVASANRDDRRYRDADRFDIHRETRAHSVFGFGIHTCLGAALARVEGRVALDEILNRFPEWEVDYDHALLSTTSTVRGWDTLPVFTRPGSRPARPRSDTATDEKPSAPATVLEPIEGKWTVTVKGPTGPMASTLTLERVDGALTGTQEGQGQSSPIRDARLEGDKLVWANEVAKPMKLKLQFSAVISGRSMTGSMKAGFMGSYPFTGVKES
jgi:cytochrome P450